MISDESTDPSGTRLFLVGRFAARVAGRPVRLTPTAERVVAFLALARRPVRRLHLAGTLWPETTDSQALTRLRSTLGKVPAADRAALVHAEAGSVTLHPDAVVDLYDLDGVAPAGPADVAGAAVAPAGVDEPPDARTHDALLRRGELLPGWHDEWVVVERERHRQLLLHALEDHSARRCRRGRFAEALAYALEAVAREPLRESAHRRVIEVHLAEGNAAEALGQYESFRRLLQSELGLPPSPAIRDLVRPLLGRPDDD